MPDWPSTLPALTELKNYSETPPNTLLATPMDAGPPKVRQEFTAAVRYISGELILFTLAEVEALDAFYATTLAGGSLTITTNHPRTNTAIVAMLLTPPVYSWDGRTWRARLEFTVMP